MKVGKVWMSRRSMTVSVSGRRVAAIPRGLRPRSRLLRVSTHRGCRFERFQSPVRSRPSSRLAHRQWRPRPRWCARARPGVVGGRQERVGSGLHGKPLLKRLSNTNIETGLDRGARMAAQFSLDETTPVLYPCFRRKSTALTDPGYASTPSLARISLTNAFLGCRVRRRFQRLADRSVLRTADRFAGMPESEDPFEARPAVDVSSVVFTAVEGDEVRSCAPVRRCRKMSNICFHAAAGAWRSPSTHRRGRTESRRSALG